MMSQRQAVYDCIFAVRNGQINGKVELNKSEKEMVHFMVGQLFLEKKVELRDESKRNAEYIKGYVPGLVNNWLRKDKKLNGGEKYEAKSPGSRQGMGDEQLQAMKALLANVKDPDLRKTIEAEITKREAFLAEKKIKPVNIDALPEHLKNIALAIAPKVIRKEQPVVESNIISVEGGPEFSES